MIEAASKYDDGEEKDYLHRIANLMKRSNLQWNSDSVKDETILKDLKQLSGDKLQVNESFVFESASDLLKKGGKKRSFKGKGKNKGRNFKKKKLSMEAFEVYGATN